MPITWTCASCHSTGTSGTHRTPWWARRAWTKCKIILQVIPSSLKYHFVIGMLWDHFARLNHVTPLLQKHFLSLWCMIKCFGFLSPGFRWRSWPPWTPWQIWRWCAYTFVFLAFIYKFWKPHICGLLFFFTAKIPNSNIVVTDSQGNNGRPGKPGDRGAPGPQVYFTQNKDTETQKDTDRHRVTE